MHISHLHLASLLLPLSRGNSAINEHGHYTDTRHPKVNNLRAKFMLKSGEIYGRYGNNCTGEKAICKQVERFEGCKVLTVCAVMCTE
jgi:hypothetical protein